VRRVSAPDHRPLPAQTGPPPPRERALARIPFYPVLVGVALIAGTFIQRDVSASAAVRTLGVAAVLGAVLTIVFAAITRSWHAGALIAATTLLVLHAGDLLHAVAGVVLAGLITFLLAYVSSLRGWSFLPGATRTLNILASALIGVLLVQSVLTGVPGRALAEGVPSDAAENPSGADPSAPDVYIVMLEDYPRADSLQRLFGFDNSAFLDDLKSLGFSVATDSRASFMHTEQNLVSLFHMTYMDDLDPVRAYDSGESPAPSLRLLINDNPVFDRLHAKGYRLFSSVGRWEAVSVRSTDVLCGTDQLNEFEFATLRDSMIGVGLDLVAPDWRSARDRSVVNAELSCAASAASATVPSARFVWAHIMAPHPPVVFAASGAAAPISVYGDVSPRPRGSQAFANAYVDELRYLNGRVIGLVREIQARSAIPPVIIVMSDEGFDASSGGTLPDRFGTLFAASTPGHADLFGDRPMTVNIFPSLFNAYLGTSLPTQPARYFTSAKEGTIQVQEIADPFASPSRGAAP